MKKKFIAWENWNEIEKMSDLEYELLKEESDDESDESMMEMGQTFQGMLSDMSPQVIHTPFGHVPYDSKFKPSDRWQCWLGYTNFGITKGVLEKLQKVEGVDALKVLSRYSFCIGVGKLFEFNEVRQNIENEICDR